MKKQTYIQNRQASCHNDKTRMGRRRGAFTLVEILFVIAIAAVLLGIVAFNMAGGMNFVRCISAKGDIKQLTTAVQLAANQCGGTLPITEGGVNPPSCDPAAIGTSITDFYNHARLEHVLLHAPGAILDKYWQPSAGLQNFTRSDGGTSGEVFYDSNTQKWKRAGTDQTAVTPGMSYANVSRLECRPVNRTATPGVDGSNFYLNGDTAVPLKGNRVAYAIYKGISGELAYLINKQVNGERLNTDTTRDGNTAQTYGTVTYAACNAEGTTDLYIYLGSW